MSRSDGTRGDDDDEEDVITREEASLRKLMRRHSSMREEERQLELEGGTNDDSGARSGLLASEDDDDDDDIEAQRRNSYYHAQDHSQTSAAAEVSEGPIAALVRMASMALSDPGGVSSPQMRPASPGHHTMLNDMKPMATESDHVLDLHAHHHHHPPPPALVRYTSLSTKEDDQTFTYRDSALSISSNSSNASSPPSPNESSEAITPPTATVQQLLGESSSVANVVQQDHDQRGEESDDGEALLEARRSHIMGSRDY